MQYCRHVQAWTGEDPETDQAGLGLAGRLHGRAPNILMGGMGKQADRVSFPDPETGLREGLQLQAPGPGWPMSPSGRLGRHVSAPPCKYPGTPAPRACQADQKKTFWKGARTGTSEGEQCDGRNSRPKGDCRRGQCSGMRLKTGGDETRSGGLMRLFDR